MLLTALKQDQYRARGLAAYYRSGGGKQPQHITFVTYKDRSYLHLHCDDFENKGILAVYRIDTGRVKRLKRWPSEVNREKWSYELMRRASDNINRGRVAA